MRACRGRNQRARCDSHAVYVYTAARRASRPAVPVQPSPPPNITRTCGTKHRRRGDRSRLRGVSAVLQSRQRAPIAYAHDAQLTTNVGDELDGEPEVALDRDGDDAVMLVYGLG